MSIDNISGSSPVNGSTSSGSSAITTAELYPNDSISSAGGLASSQVMSLANTPQLPIPRINLNKYLQTLHDSRLKLERELIDYENSIHQGNLKISGELGAWAVAEQEKKAAVTSNFTNQMNLFKSQLSAAISYNVNTITSYNDVLSTMSSYASAMYNIQQQYKNGQITNAEYNAAVDQWNAAVAGYNTAIQDAYNAYSQATTAYNAQVAANNQEVQTINAQRAELKITPPLPTQELATLVPLTLLPTNLPHDPPLSSLPSLPQSLAAVPYISETIGLSTTINVSPPVTGAEQALLDSISQSLDAINNGSLNNYNRALAAHNSQIALLNQAIRDFSQGLIDQAAYDAAVNVFASYATSANAQLTTLANAYLSDLNNYNNSLTAINSQIDDFNAARRLNDRPPLPKQSSIPIPELSSLLLPTAFPSTPSPPAINPLDNGPFTLVPNTPSGSSIPTIGRDYLNQYYTPDFMSLLLSFISFLIGILRGMEQSDHYFNFLKGDKLLTPHGAKEYKPNVVLNEKQATAGISGVGLTVLIAGIDNSALSAILSAQLLSESTQFLSDKKLPDGLADKTLAFALGALQETALAAALKGAQLLKDNPSAVFPGSPAVEAALSLALADLISSMLSSGTIENVLAAYLAEAGLSPEDQALLQTILGSAITSGILQFVLSQIATSLDLKGLLPQLLANLTGISEEFRQQILALLDNQVLAALQNRASAQALQSYLTDLTVARNAPNRTLVSEQLNRAINKAINERNIATAQELRDGLLDYLLQENFDLATAQRLADQGINFLREEQSLANLDSPYLQRQLQRDLNLSQELQRAIQNAQQNSYETNRQYRGALVNELQRQGVDVATAYSQANDILKSQLLQDNIRSSSFSSEIINREGLQRSLNQTIEQAAINRASLNQQTILNDANQSQSLLNQALNQANLTQSLLNQEINQNNLNQAIQNQASLSQALNQALQNQANLNQNNLNQAIQNQSNFSQALNQAIQSQAILNQALNQTALNQANARQALQSQANLNQALNQAIQNQNLLNQATLNQIGQNQDLLQSSIDQANLNQNLLNQALQSTLSLNQDNLNQTLLKDSLNRANLLLSTINQASSTREPLPSLSNRPELLAPQEDIRLTSSTAIDLYREEIEQAFNSSLERTIAQRLTSENQFNIVLALELRASGIGKETAEELARKTTAILAGQNDPLKNALVGFLNREELQARITNAITGRLTETLGPAQAAFLANQLANIIVGATPSQIEGEHQDKRLISLFDLMDRAHEKSQVVYTEETRESQIENYRSFLTKFSLNPTARLAVNLQDFFERVMDPAYNLLYMAANGIMYAGMGRKPSNFKFPVDIQI